MADYTTSVNFTAKDSLPSGDPQKVIKGSDFQLEFDAIATASSTKADLASPTFTGAVTVPDLTISGSVTGTLDGGTY
jgi:hypothetical protein